jgi:hypothetical protein
LKNVECTIGPSNRVKIDALSTMYVFVPDIGYRMALEDCCDSEREGARNNEGQNGPALDSKSSCREDLEVKYKDRHLDETECDDVENLAKID